MRLLLNHFNKNKTKRIHVIPTNNKTSRSPTILAVASIRYFHCHNYKRPGAEVEAAEPVPGERVGSALQHHHARPVELHNLGHQRFISSDTDTNHFGPSDPGLRFSY